MSFTLPTSHCYPHITAEQTSESLSHRWDHATKPPITGQVSGTCHQHALRRHHAYAMRRSHGLCLRHALQRRNPVCLCRALQRRNARCMCRALQRRNALWRSNALRQPHALRRHHALRHHTSPGSDGQWKRIRLRLRQWEWRLSMRKQDARQDKRRRNLSGADVDVGPFPAAAKDQTRAARFHIQQARLRRGEQPSLQTVATEEDCNDLNSRARGKLVRGLGVPLRARECT